VQYETEEEYREHFERVYCSNTLTTFDGIDVRFFPERFDHAFHEGTFKSGFSRERAERIDWIGAALTDEAARLYIGWDTDRRREMPNRRVCVAGANYVVIINCAEEREIRYGLRGCRANSPGHQRRQKVDKIKGRLLRDSGRTLGTFPL
jgi:hypothetical protein